MRAPIAWIKEYVDLPAEVDSDALTSRLTALGLKLEAIERAADGFRGPLVVGRVLTMESEPQTNGKTINWCSVDVGRANGTGEPQGIVCGAHNFRPGDLVVCVLPGGRLPTPDGGGFEISARKTYGHISAGMICSARELRLSEDHDGILVLPPDAGEPGEDALGVLGLDEEVIEFEINPDRAYALSLRGISREAALGFSRPFRDPMDRLEPSADESAYPIEIEAETGCDVFAARSVSGFNPQAATPEWMARRLRQCGMRPISLAVDVTNYVMLETGQPIHGYDRDTLTGAIRVRNATPGETLRTLDGVERTLVEQDVVITDDSGPIGLAGVMGGETTHLSATTSNIVIEAARWDPVRVFRTAARHKLPSEAAKRFERGIDPTIALRAADRVAELLVEHGGGVVDPGVSQIGVAPAAPAIAMAADLPSRVSGVPIDTETVMSCLQGIGATVALAEGQVSVVAPPWRPDLSDPFDLVEEVVRIVGYDQVPSVLPTAPVGRGLSRSQRLRRRVGRALASYGCVEVMSFPFLGERELDLLRLADDDPRRTVLRLANPLSAEEPAMTTTLLPGLLKTAARNVARGQSDLALCEVASVTCGQGQRPAPILPVGRRPTEQEYADLQAALPRQPLHAAVVLTGEATPRGWWGAGRSTEWSDAVDVVRCVGEDLGVQIGVQAAGHPPWHPGRCARLLVGEQVLGYAGELHPRVCHDFGVPARSAAVEIDLDLLLSHAVEVVAAAPLSVYPLAKEDVALVVGDDVPAAEVEAALREGAGELLESISLFDIYTGDQVGAGKKSLAYALRFRAPDRTLLEGEAAAARDAAIARAAARTDAVQRT